MDQWNNEPNANGIRIQLGSEEFRSNGGQPIVQLEQIQSITLGNTSLDDDERGIPLNAVVEFLSSTRSRTSLKELRLFNVIHETGAFDIVDRLERDQATLDRFASSFINGREIQLPLKLEKFSFMSEPFYSLHIRLDTMDTSRLTDVRVRNASIEPEQLTNLIERATHLRRIDLSFMSCGHWGDCDGPRLEANKRLLTALASRANLRAIRFDSGHSYDSNCMAFGIEFIQMLRTIGDRGQLRRLALEEHFVNTSSFNLNELSETIETRLPYLKSIKVFDLEDGIDIDIANLVELEEIYFRNDEWSGVTAETMTKVAQLPHLHRLAIDAFNHRINTRSLKCLANAHGLVDLRIGAASIINTPVYERWAGGFAPNLQILMLTGVAEEFESHLDGLIQLLKATVRLRVLILRGRINVRLLKAIAQSCRELEILGVQTKFNHIEPVYLQLIVNHCTKLRKLGGIENEIWNRLRFPMGRQIVDVDMKFWQYDFDDAEYE